MLNLISRLKLSESMGFVESLAKADNPRSLHKIIIEILNEFKK